MKIVALAETHYVGMIPHFTGPISEAALVHCLTATSVTALMEMLGDGTRTWPYLPKGYDFKDGKLWPNDRPGLGVELDSAQADAARRIRDISRRHVAQPPTGRLLHELVIPLRKLLAVIRFVSVLFAALALWCVAAPVGAQVAPGPDVNPRTVWSEPPEQFTTRVVASGFEDPFEVAWGPDGWLWITERVGKRVVRVNPADGTRKVAVTIDEVYQKLAQEGLLGLALDPRLLHGSNYVYVMYTYDADPGPAEERRAKIRRYTYDPVTEQLKDPHDVLTNLPHGPDHGASRLVYGPDGKLYASRGDQGANFLAYYCVPNRAQELPTAAEVRAHDWQRYQGKILRINLNGSIPRDNPVLAGVRSHVFAYGNRNPQGMAFGPDGCSQEVGGKGVPVSSHLN